MIRNRKQALGNRHVWLWVGLLATCLWASPAQTQKRKNTKRRQYAIKAQMIAKMTPYVAWPKGTLKRNQTFKIGVIGVNPFGTMLDNVFKRVRVHGHRSEVVQFGAWPVADRKKDPKGTRHAVRVAQMRKSILQCHAIFIAGSERGALKEIKSAVRRAPIWLLSDSTGFAKQGMHINFKLSSANVKFDTNAKAARRAGIRMSSKLLRLGDKEVK